MIFGATADDEINYSKDKIKKIKDVRDYSCIHHEILNLALLIPHP